MKKQIKLFGLRAIIREQIERIMLNETMLNVSNMSFPDFKKKYIELAKYAKESEKKGKLDYHDSSYIPMTKDEESLSQSNWKEFSRGRGFSEDDINKYSEWLKISGQQDLVGGAVNDPWRRAGLMSGSDVNLDYLTHIYDSIKQAELKLAENRFHNKDYESDYDKAKYLNYDQEDVWHKFDMIDKDDLDSEDEHLADDLGIDPFELDYRLDSIRNKISDKNSQQEPKYKNIY